jgi:hypothetical protein
MVNKSAVFLEQSQEGNALRTLTFIFTEVNMSHDNLRDFADTMVKWSIDAISRLCEIRAQARPMAG